MPRPIEIAAGAWLSGLWAAHLGLGRPSGVAFAAAMWALPRWRSARIAGLAAALAICLGGDPAVVLPPGAETAVGTVVGPIHRGPFGQRFSLRGNSDTEITVSAPHSELQPCDRVRLSGRWVGRELRAHRLSRERRWCPSPWRLADALQLRWRQVVVERDRPGGELVRAMVLGDRSGVGPAVRESFRRAGVAHVLAVSGLHLAVVAVLVFGLFRRLVAAAIPGARSHLWAAVAASLAAIAFAAVTGARVSTLRALVMALIALLAIASGRRPDARSALAAFAILATGLAPALVTDPGFQLSAAATAALVWSRPILRCGWWRIPALALRASAATALATAPIASHHFGEVAWVGVVANLLVVPLVGLGVVPVGLLGLAVFELAPQIGAPLIDVASYLAGAVGELAELFASAEPMYGVLRPLPACTCALAAFALGRARTRRGALGALTAALVAIAAPLLGVASGAATGPRGALEVTFVDVGQGDGAILRFPNGKVWVVDVGPSTPARPPPVLRHLRSMGIAKIDTLIISHAHPDHDGSAQVVEAAVPVGHTWRLGDSGAPQPGPRMGVHTLGAARAWVLAPGIGERAARDPVMSENDNSLVILVEYAGRSILFAGDIEAEAEERLLSAHPGLGAIDVIKVPHHGSKTSSTRPLVARLSAGVAVISVGRANRYGHPDPAVLYRWRDHGAVVVRTDHHGTVRLRVHADGSMRIRYREADP